MTKVTSSARVKKSTVAPNKKRPAEAATIATSIEVRFAQAGSKLNPHRQQLVRAILEAPDETCFLSSRELAKRYGVDAATIVRTTQALGYGSFADFATDLRQHFMMRITPYTVLKAATEERRSVADHIDHSLSKAQENLNNLIIGLDRKKVIALARQIDRSQLVVAVGVDFASSLAQYLSYGLLAMGYRSEALTGSTGLLQHKLSSLTPKDLVIGISFGQCLKDTVEAIQQSKKQSVPTFGITDSDTTPLARYSDNYLLASVAVPSFLASYVAPVAAISAIHVACVHVNPRRTLNRLRPTDKEYISGRRWYREPKGSSRGQE
jgi:DNA-binding MurR/RpiR family transcriptional regulator